MSASEQEMNRFKEVTSKHFADQCIFFLNAFWDEHQNDANQVYEYYLRFVKINKGLASGSSLDEHESHRFLESFGETLTALALREQMRKIDLDFDRRMAPVEYLLFRYERDMKTLLERPQGSNEELIKAQNALKEAQAKIQEIEDKRKVLEEKAKGEGIKAKQAVAELLQLDNIDMTPINRLLLSAEAAVRKAKKLGGDQPQGALWWVQKEIEIARSYKPRGGAKPIA